MSPKTEITILILAAIAAGIILKFGFGGERDFENAALGTLTVQYQAAGPEGVKVHTIKQPESEIASMLSHAQGSDALVLVLGNSQTHSINQKEKGHVVYPELLQNRLPDRIFLTNSLPNANLQEFYTILNWWNDQLDFKTVLIPVFMDDLREDGLRKDFLKGLVRDEHTIEPELDELDTEWNQILASFQNTQEEGTVSSEGIETPQERSEKYITSWLSDRSEMWRNRPNARGDLFMKLYQWRNQLFGINASTKRKIIPARYDKNLTALSKILNFCQERGINCVVYIPPIRTDVEVPYDLNEYALFKEEVQQITEMTQTSQFHDLDGIIPGKYWGLKASTNTDAEPELDFMHFQFRGHEILADSLEQILRRQ